MAQRTASRVSDTLLRTSNRRGRDPLEALSLDDAERRPRLAPPSIVALQYWRRHAFREELKRACDSLSMSLPVRARRPATLLSSFFLRELVHSLM